MTGQAITDPADLERDQCAFIIHHDGYHETICGEPGAFRYWVRPEQYQGKWWASPGFQSGIFYHVSFVVACYEHRLDNHKYHIMDDPIETWIEEIEVIGKLPKDAMPTVRIDEVNCYPDALRNTMSVEIVGSNGVRIIMSEGQSAQNYMTDSIKDVMVAFRRCWEVAPDERRNDVIPDYKAHSEPKFRNDFGEWYITDIVDVGGAAVESDGLYLWHDGKLVMPEDFQFFEKKGVGDELA